MTQESITLHKHFPLVRREILRFLFTRHNDLIQMNRGEVFAQLAEHLRANTGAEYGSFRRHALDVFSGQVSGPEERTSDGLRIHDLHALENAFHELENRHLVTARKSNKAHLLPNALEKVKREIYSQN